MDEFGPTAESSEPLPLLGLEHAIEVGRGGYGTVYRARDPALQRDVAVKVMSDRLDITDAARFTREGQAMSLLSGHPNVMPVYTSGVTPDRRVYLVMPFAERGSLADRLREGPLPWPEAVSIAIRLAGALQAAHTAGILHRDVKPANVLMSDYGEPWLSDFGIARVAGAYETTRPGLAASVVYAAPEILNGGQPTRAADVYSLGATTFHMLAGRPAFVATDSDASDGGLMGLYLRIAREPVPDLRADGVPDEVRAAVEAAMAKNPEDRPASAQAFGELLRAAAAANGHDAPMASAARLRGSEPRRSRKKALVVAGPIIGLVAVAVVWVWAARDGNTTVPNAPQRAAKIVDVTPAAGPIAIGATPSMVTGQVNRGEALEVGVAAHAGQRVLARVHLTGRPSKAVGISLANTAGPLDSTTIDGSDGVLGPVAIDSTTSYILDVGPVPDAVGVTVTVSTAADDVHATAAVGGPAVTVTLAEPHQIALVTFAGRSGQKVHLVWARQGDPFDVDLVLFGPDGKQVATMSSTGSGTSDPITLPADGNYAVRVAFSGDLTGTGQLSVTTASAG